MSSTKPFSFDTIEDFDQHIAKSIPNYHLLSSAIADLSTFFTKADTKVVDLGCSTGKLLEAIPFKGDKIGIDISDNLLPESKDNLLFINKDLRAIKDFSPASFITSVFTLQFLPKEDRLGILEKVYESLIEGGAFVWCEKVEQRVGAFERLFTNAHYDFKRHEFTSQEILDKERDLRSIMTPNLSIENLYLAEDAGFTEYAMFWKFYNFEGWVFIK